MASENTLVSEKVLNNSLTSIISTSPGAGIVETWGIPLGIRYLGLVSLGLIR